MAVLLSAVRYPTLSGGSSGGGDDDEAVRARGRPRRRTAARKRSTVAAMFRERRRVAVGHAGHRAAEAYAGVVVRGHCRQHRNGQCEEGDRHRYRRAATPGTWSQLPPQSTTRHRRPSTSITHPIPNRSRAR